MRKVDRKNLPQPEILASERAKAAYRDLVAQIDTQNDVFNRRPKLDNELINSFEVADALTKLFRGACAYCEQTSEPLDVDHFRPQLSAGDLHEESSSFLHYVWLAYDWNNLYPCCRECNASKRSRFPVKGRRAPALFSIDEIRARETALLVDPCHDRPEKHFHFGLDGICVGLSLAGRTSIEVMALNRPTLVSARARAINNAVHDALSGNFDGDAVFRDGRPHLGAIEIFARRVSVALADHLGVARPTFATQLDRFSGLLQSVPADEIQELLSEYIVPTPALYTQSQGLAPVYAPQHHRRLNRGIKRITIDKFKSIDHLVLEVGEHGPDFSKAGGLMLLADNAAGKTSVLQAVALAVIGPEHASHLDIDRDLLVRKDRQGWGQSEKVPAHVRVDFHSGETSEVVLNPFTLEFSGRSDAVDGLMAYGAHRLLGRRKVRARAPYKRVASLFDSLAEVPHPEEWLADHRTPFEIVARALSEVLVLHDDDRIARDTSGNVSIRTYGQQTPIDVLSDGYKSVIAMSVDMIHWLLRDWPDLETARGVVLIDEIDAHLHPRWKLQIVGALRAALPGVQFITTTHDPLCLRGMGQGEVVVMKRSSTQHFDLIVDLPDFRTMSAEQILMSDYFGLNTTSDTSADVLIGATADRFVARSGDALTVAVDEALDGLMIGESPERQVADAAMLKYLRERKSASGQAVSSIRREAIEAALKAIRAGDAKK